jgi:hypothetical protein
MGHNYFQWTDCGQDSASELALKMIGGSGPGMNEHVETNENSWNERRLLDIVDSTSHRIGLDLGGVGTRRHR